VQFSIFLAYDKWWSVFPIAGAQQDMPRQQAKRYGQCCCMSSCVSSPSRNCLCTAAASLPICFAFSQARPSCSSLVLHRSSKQGCEQAYRKGDLCKPVFSARKTAVNVCVLQVRNKQAKMGKSLSKNLNKISSNAERTVRQGRRKGFKLPSLLTGSRTTG